MPRQRELSLDERLEAVAGTTGASVDDVRARYGELVAAGDAEPMWSVHEHFQGLRREKALAAMRKMGIV